jgi:cytochrome P450
VPVEKGGAGHAVPLTGKWIRWATMPATTAVPNERPVFDPFDPRWSSDPYPLYAELRERAPVHRNEMGFWVFARALLH